MARNFDSRALYNLVEIKRVTDSAVASEMTRLLRAWAARVIECCPSGQIPDADLDMIEVGLLTAALGNPQSITPVIEQIEHMLLSVWRETHGYTTETPWVVEAYDAACGGGKQGIHLRVKVLNR